MEYFRMFNNQMVTVSNAPQKQKAGMHRFVQILLLLSLAVILSACGNDTQNPSQPEDPSKANKGGQPATTDTQNFKREFWSQLNGPDTCGGCHDLGGTGTTKFVDTNDINKAYKAALTLVKIDNTAASPIVTKFVSPNTHNCWLATDQACADTIKGYIDNWIAARDEAQAIAKLVLEAPAELKDAGDSRNFPAQADGNSPNGFADTVYPLLTAHCSSCHSESAVIPQSPFFANTDIVSAYQAAKTKMKIDFTTARDSGGINIVDSFGNPVMEAALYLDHV